MGAAPGVMLWQVNLVKKVVFPPGGATGGGGFERWLRLPHQHGLFTIGFGIFGPR
jgi:hypothetical protein